MELNEYQRLAQRTRNPKLKPEQKQSNGLCGIIGEAGEIMDLYKKHYFQGHELKKEDVIEEVGDLLWYVAELCSGWNIGIEEVAIQNIAKLTERYPDGFQTQKSINRKENQATCKYTSKNEQNKYRNILSKAGALLDRLLRNLE